MIETLIQPGKQYLVRVSGKIAAVRVEAHHALGWFCRNIETNRPVRVRGCARFRCEIPEFATAEQVQELKTLADDMHNSPRAKALLFETRARMVNANTQEGGAL